MSSKVYSSIIDKNGKLWIGCEDGIYQIEDEKVNLVKEILGEHIKKFYEDRKGNLWAISTKNLYLIKDKEIKKTNFLEEILKQSVECMVEDEHGNYWFGTRFNGLYKYYNGKLENFPLKEDLTYFPVRSLLIDNEGSLWIATNSDGIYRLKDTRFSVLTEEEGLKNNRVWGISERGDGSIYIRTVNGLDIFKNGEIINANKIPGLEKYKNLNMSIDREGILWVYIYDLGIVSIKDFTILKIFPLKEIKNSIILSMYHSKDNDLYLGSDAGRNYKFKNGKLENLTYEDEVSGAVRFFF